MRTYKDTLPVRSCITRAGMVSGVVIWVFATGVAMAAPVEEMQGGWSGQAVSSHFRAKALEPEYSQKTPLYVRVAADQSLKGAFGDGCKFKGKILNSSSSQYPIEGEVGDCKIKEMNGSFTGMFNRYGEIRLIVKDLKLGRGDFYGRLAPALETDGVSVARIRIREY